MNHDDIPMGDKVSHVRAEMRVKDHRHHHCHWPGCGKQVPPAQWGCTGHWKMLPQELRNQVWRAYRPGQEVSKRPSESYMVAARAVQAWIQANHPPKEPLFRPAPAAPAQSESSQGSLFWREPGGPKPAPANTKPV